MSAFPFMDDVTHQEIATEGATTIRIHTGDLFKRCTRCNKMMKLVEDFGRFRRMNPGGNEYRTQAQCKTCRGPNDD